MLALDIDIGVLGTLLTDGGVPAPDWDFKLEVGILMPVLEKLAFLIGVLKDMMRLCRMASKRR